MSKRGENIYKRRDGRWEGRYLVWQEGRQKYVSVYGKTCAAVRQKLLICKQQLAASQNAKPQPGSQLTVQALFADWLRRKQPVLKPSSYARYAGLLNTQILPELGGCPLNKLTAQKIAAFMANKMQSGRLDKQGGLAAKTIADILSLIKSAVKMAARDFAIGQSAAILNLRPPAARCAGKPEIFTEPEVGQLTENLLAAPSASQAAVLLCLNSGLRLGEVCALRWSDIDWMAQTLTVQRTVQRVTQNGHSELLLQTPKTEAARRTIPLTADLLALLARSAKARAEQSYIFGGQRPLEPRTMQYRFASLLKRCGIPARNFHVLRHTFASRFIALGGNVKSLSELLGHANIRTTMQLYVHPSLAQKRADMELVNTLHGLGCV